MIGLWSHCNLASLETVQPRRPRPGPALGGDRPGGFRGLLRGAEVEPGDTQGRHRESFTKARPITPDKPLQYRFALPTANHVFRPGHRIMVQIQSSWFPLYDRNPQTFVPNIFWAKPGDYRKATQRVYHSAKERSFIELPLAAR
jgi:predicted acyl esterase